LESQGNIEFLCGDETHITQDIAYTPVFATFGQFRLPIQGLFQLIKGQVWLDQHQDRANRDITWLDSQFDIVHFHLRKSDISSLVRKLAAVEKKIKVCK